MTATTDLATALGGRRRRGRGRLVLLLSAVALVASMAAVGLTVAAPAGPVSADCSGLSAWPSFRHTAASARDVVIGTVTDSALPDGFASRFTLTVDDVLKGEADGPTIEFDRFHSGAPEPLCPDGSVLRVRPGDRIALASGARLPGQEQRITSVAYIVPSRPDRQLLPKMERLTEAQVKRIVGVPAVVVHSPAPSVEPTGAASGDPDDCRGEFPDIEGGQELSPDELATACTQQRVRELMQPVLDYAQAEVDYAGMVFEGSTARFWFTTDLSGHLSQLQAIAPKGAVVDVSPASLTLTELAAVQRAVTDDAKALVAGGIPIQTVAIDPTQNAVIVGLKAAVAGGQRDLQQRYGPHVLTEVVGQISEDGG